MPETALNDIDYSEAGERVVPLRADFNFYSHLSIYHLAVPFLPQGARILDAGCGTGYGTKYLFDREPQAGKAVGIDLSPVAIAFCREHYDVKRLRFRRCDLGQPLPFSEGSFDFIFTSNAMEHVAAFESAIAEFHRVLSPDGILFFAVPAITTAEAMEDNKRNPHHLTNLTPAEWHRHLARRFSEIASFRHWPKAPLNSWPAIRSEFQKSPEQTTTRETSFSLLKTDIRDLDADPDVLNAVFLCRRRPQRSWLRRLLRR